MKIGKEKYKVCRKKLDHLNLRGYITKGEKKKGWERIAYNKSLKREDVESTLIHEILHGIDWYGLSERDVIRLEKRLVKFFKENGWKITW